MQQRLRFPGQEAIENNDGTEKAYNVFRWYRAGWGRYTLSDPILLFVSLSEDQRSYAYALENPTKFIDPLGLYTVRGNCKRCEALDPKAKNLSEYIPEETSRFCREKLNGIVDVRLRGCIRESCRSGIVECVDCDDPADLGYTKFAGGSIADRIHRASATRTAYVCVGNNLNYSGQAGNTVIHEWSHGCGYNPHGGRYPGIPDEPAAPQPYQRRFPKRGRE